MDQIREFCQIQGCGVNLGSRKSYFRRYKICPDHLRCPVLDVDGVFSRFCQQCGRFQPVTDFDGSKRSCRDSLARHKSRRLKRTSPETPGSNGSAGSIPSIISTQHLTAKPAHGEALLHTRAAGLSTTKRRRLSNTSSESVSNGSNGSDLPASTSYAEPALLPRSPTATQLHGTRLSTSTCMTNSVARCTLPPETQTTHQAPASEASPLVQNEVSSQLHAAADQIQTDLKPDSHLNADSSPCIPHATHQASCAQASIMFDGTASSTIPSPRQGVSGIMAAMTDELKPSGNTPASPRERSCRHAAAAMGDLALRDSLKSAPANAFMRNNHCSGAAQPVCHHELGSKAGTGMDHDREVNVGESGAGLPGQRHLLLDKSRPSSSPSSPGHFVQQSAERYQQKQWREQQQEQWGQQQQPAPTFAESDTRSQSTALPKQHNVVGMVVRTEWIGPSMANKALLQSAHEAIHRPMGSASDALCMPKECHAAKCAMAEVASPGTAAARVHPGHKTPGTAHASMEQNQHDCYESRSTLPCTLATTNCTGLANTEHKGQGRDIQSDSTSANEEYSSDELSSRTLTFNVGLPYVSEDDLTDYACDDWLLTSLLMDEPASPIIQDKCHTASDTTTHHPTDSSDEIIKASVTHANICTSNVPSRIGILESISLPDTPCSLSLAFSPHSHPPLGSLLVELPTHQHEPKSPNGSTNPDGNSSSDSYAMEEDLLEMLHASASVMYGTPLSQASQNYLLPCHSNVVQPSVGKPHTDMLDMVSAGKTAACTTQPAHRPAEGEQHCPSRLSMPSRSPKHSTEVSHEVMQVPAGFQSQPSLPHCMDEDALERHIRNTRVVVTSAPMLFSTAPRPDLSGPCEQNPISDPCLIDNDPTALLPGYWQGFLAGLSQSGDVTTAFNGVMPGGRQALYGTAGLSATQQQQQVIEGFSEYYTSNFSMAAANATSMYTAMSAKVSNNRHEQFTTSFDDFPATSHCRYQKYADRTHQAFLQPSSDGVKFHQQLQPPIPSPLMAQSFTEAACYPYESRHWQQRTVPHGRDTAMWHSAMQGFTTQHPCFGRKPAALELSSSSPFVLDHPSDCFASTW